MAFVPAKCVGIATGGCSMTISEPYDAIQDIRNRAVKAVHCPCFSHALNLSLLKFSSSLLFKTNEISWGSFWKHLFSHRPQSEMLLFDMF